LKFFAYLLPFKSYSCVFIWLEIWHPGSEIWGFWGISTPKCNFLSMQPPKGTSLQQTASFEPTCVQIGSAVFAVDDYKKKKGKVR
jgi:hypothetical protein